MYLLKSGKSGQPNIHHSNVSHGQHEGHGEMTEPPSKVNTEVWEGKQSDGGHEVNLKNLNIYRK